MNKRVIWAGPLLGFLVCPDVFKRSYTGEEYSGVLWQQRVGLMPDVFSLFFSGQIETNAGPKRCMRWRKNIDFPVLIFNLCDLAEKQYSRDMGFFRWVGCRVKKTARQLTPYNNWALCHLSGAPSPNVLAYLMQVTSIWHSSVTFFKGGEKSVTRPYLRFRETAYLLNTVTLERALLLFHI